MSYAKISIFFRNTTICGTVAFSGGTAAASVTAFRTAGQKYFLPLRSSAMKMNSMAVNAHSDDPP